LPRDVPIGLEVPMSKRALAGNGGRGHVRACVEGVRRLLPTKFFAQEWSPFA
jgi:hypothetical protein